MVTKAVAVEAPTTDSGPWLVVATALAGRYDDGTYADDDFLIELALVSADGLPEEATVIQIGGSRRDVPGNWSNVSWGPELRAQGEAAAENALACLDEIVPDLSAKPSTRESMQSAHDDAHSLGGTALVAATKRL